MNKIEVKILNHAAVKETEKNMVFVARLTQRGHAIHSMDDLMELYEKSFGEELVKNISHLPHPTVQKFSVITVAVVGASRRFLSQITRHQNEVKFMSASLQYSDYSGEAAFAVPYEILMAEENIRKFYMDSCQSDMDCYEELCSMGIHHDAAGYATPQGLRNVLIISATTYQWKHMIGQRSCRRNTDEMRIVMLKIWQELYQFSPVLFAPDLTGPFCQRGICAEGKMTCGNPLKKSQSPEQILQSNYPVLVEGGTDESKTD